MQPSTEVRTEYLMTYQAPLEAPTPIDETLLIVNVPPGPSWARGPSINATFLPPGGDWLRIMPSGVMRLDVRATMKTDDGALIYVSYNGIMQHTEHSAERMNRGEVLTAADVPYFVTAPTFQTAAPKYAWLNAVQAIGKLVELRLGAGGYVRYDVFVVR
jgi:hypothetical protein